MYFITASRLSERTLPTACQNMESRITTPFLSCHRGGRATAYLKLNGFADATNCVWLVRKVEEDAYFQKILGLEYHTFTFTAGSPSDTLTAHLTVAHGTLVAL